MFIPISISKSPPNATALFHESNAHPNNIIPMNCILSLQVPNELNGLRRWHSSFETEPLWPPADASKMMGMTTKVAIWKQVAVMTMTVMMG